MALNSGALSIHGAQVVKFTAGAKSELAGLMRVGKVTTYTDTTHFISSDLIGQDDDAFDGWYVSVLQADNAAPEGELRAMSDYASSTGTVTHTAFSAALAAGDWVVLLRPEIAMLGTVATSAATGAPTTTDLLVAYVKQIVNNTYKLAEAADGAGVYPASIASDSLLAKLMGVGDPAVVTGYNNTTDSLEAQRANFDAVIGTLATAAAAGPVTTADLIMAYMKQLINIFQLADPDLDPSVLDDSPFAQLLAVDGDVSAYNDNLHSLQALYNKMVAVQGGSETLESIDDELDAMIDMVSTVDTTTITSIGTEETITALTTTNTTPMWVEGIKLGLENLAAGDMIKFRVFADWDDASIADQINADPPWVFGGVQTPSWAYLPVRKWITYELRIKMNQYAGTAREIYTVLDLGQRGS